MCAQLTRDLFAIAKFLLHMLTVDRLLYIGGWWWWKGKMSYALQTCPGGTVRGGGYVSGELSDSLLNGARSHWLKVNNVCATAIQWRTQRVHVVVHVHPKS